MQLEVRAIGQFEAGLVMQGLLYRLVEVRFLIVELKAVEMLGSAQKVDMALGDLPVLRVVGEWGQRV